MKWNSVPLGDILTERKETPDPDALVLGDVRILSKISFSTGQIELRRDSKTRTTMIMVQPGDLVISGINAHKGAVAVYSKHAVYPIAATIHYSCYVPNENMVENNYLWWLLRSRMFRELLAKHVPGGIKTELKAKRFLPIPVPLPPLEEQRRIVAHIEVLVQRIEEARAFRQAAMRDADALFEAEINKAFEACPTDDSCSLKDLTTKIGSGSTPRGGKAVYLERGIPFVPKSECKDAAFSV